MSPWMPEPRDVEDLESCWGEAPAVYWLFGPSAYICRSRWYFQDEAFNMSFHQSSESSDGQVSRMFTYIKIVIVGGVELESPGPPSHNIL
jgi:hypothetical protein